jgi:DnaD/phage-associated family protein
MSRYATIYTKIWQDEIFRGLDSDAQMLFLYLLTSPHSNLIGLYYLPAAYIAEDLGKGFETVSQGLNTLSDKGLIRYDAAARVVLVCNYLKYNPLQNRNQAVGAATVLANLPKTPLVAAFLECVEKYCPTYRSHFETLSKGFPKGFETVSKPESESDTESDTESESSARAREADDVDDVVDNSDGDSAVYDPVIKQLVNFYFETFGKIPSPLILDDLSDWADKLGPDLVCEAMRRTAAANSRSWKYSEAILRNWRDSRVRTMADVERLDREHQARMSRRAPPALMPEEPEPVPVRVDPEEVARSQAELRRVMEELMPKELMPDASGA